MSDFKRIFRHQAHFIKKRLRVRQYSAYSILAGINGYSDLHDQQQAIKTKRDELTLLAQSVHPNSPYRHVTDWEDTFALQVKRVRHEFGWSSLGAKDFVAGMHGFDGWKNADLSLARSTLLKTV